MWRFLFVQKENLVLGLVEDVVQAQELLEGVLQGWLLALWNRYLEGDWRVVEQVLTFVL